VVTFWQLDTPIKKQLSAKYYMGWNEKLAVNHAKKAMFMSK
jgi:hypothetical protein